MKINQFLFGVLHKAKQTKKQRQFGVLIIAVILIVLFFSLKKADFNVVSEKDGWLIVITGLIAVFSILKPIVLFPVLWVWFLIGDFIGIIMSYVLLSIIYFFVFSPVAFIMNFFTKNKYEAKWHIPQNDINYEELK